VVRSTFTEFFAATAASAAGLIGLLFVALTLAATRSDLRDEFVRLETRAGAALLSFINVLVISLVALIPGDHIGWTAIAVGLVGELYAAASVVVLEEDRKPDADPDKAETSRRLIFTLAVGFALQTAFGVLVVIHPQARGWLGGLAALQVGSLVLGIGRTWEIIGVRDPGIRASMRLLKRRGR
jgi:hypothetical protein